MTASPLDRLLRLVATRVQAVELGHQDGPPPGRLVRLAVLVENNRWVLLAVDQAGWVYRTELSITDVLELLPGRPPDSELH